MVGLDNMFRNLPQKVVHAIDRQRDLWDTNHQIVDLARQVFHHTSQVTKSRVVFFNASTRLYGLSLNAAYALLASWALRLQGAPVTNFICHAGMSRCVLAPKATDPRVFPPCGACMAQSRQISRYSDVYPFIYMPNSRLQDLVANLDLARLVSFSFEDLLLGPWVLPSVRWVLRRHNLQDDEATLFLYRQYILSAWGIAGHFSKMLDAVNPECVVVFNGMFFPEAVARQVALKRGLRVITHEVGMQPLSAFFTTGEATAYPTELSKSFELDAAQNAQLDAYLAKRFQGDFSMAGIRFWPEITHLDADFQAKVSQYKKIVPVFTNVVFDTSQPHSNVVFPHMFAWLDLVLGLIKQHPDTVFVIRAHPDEFRAGKESRESVRQWVSQNRIADFPNVIFVDANEPFSSYELIQRAHFVMVYNSTIGLEASIMGKPVLSGGKARYTQDNTVFFPDTPAAYQRMAESFLTSQQIVVPPEFRLNARRFLFYQAYRFSLPFNQFLKVGNRPGFVKLQDFRWQALLPENSETMRVITNGILTKQPFIIGDAKLFT